MNTLNRMKSSTAVIAAFAAGLVLLAASGQADAGGNGHQGQGGGANSSAASAAAKATPIYTCMACRFVKRDGGDKLARKPKPARDMAVRGMSRLDKPGRDKQADNKPVATAGAKPTAPAAITPAAPAAITPAAPAASPLKIVKLSDGKDTSVIPDNPRGLMVTSTSPGTLTVSNGTNSVTFPNTQAVTLSGYGSVSAGAGVQTFRQKNGDLIAVIETPATAPKPPPAPAPGTVTGGPEGGFFHALGSSIEQGVKDFIDPPFRATRDGPQ